MQATQGTILVVDDTELNRLMLSNWLRDQGHRVVTARSGREALSQLRESPVDLILLDILMPEMDGYQVLEHLKGDAQLHQLPVIVVSAVDDLDSIVKCIELGAEDYLYKPFNVTLLKARIKASLEKRTLRQQEESYRQQLMATQRLASLGTLAAGVAHELSSPLQVITGVSETLLLRMAQDNALPRDALLERLDAIKRNSWRCAQIVGALRTYAHASTGVVEANDLNGLVNDALLLVASQLHAQADVRVVTQLAPDLPPLPCDRNAIMQALLNLLANARDALPHGGEIRVTTTYDPAAHQFSLKVADTGEGISDAVRSRIFDPFYTTKPLGQGTGLGLSVVSGIVSAHGGSVQVESTPGHGAAFTLFFPLVNPLPAAVLPGLEARFDDSVAPLPPLETAT
jgi:signal transduction histidine kinase